MRDIFPGQQSDVEVNMLQDCWNWLNTGGNKTSIADASIPAHQKLMQAPAYVVLNKATIQFWAMESIFREPTNKHMKLVVWIMQLAHQKMKLQGVQNNSDILWFCRKSRSYGHDNLGTAYELSHGAIEEGKGCNLATSYLSLVLYREHAIGVNYRFDFTNVITG